MDGGGLCKSKARKRKRVYLGLGHKRGTLSWLSPFSHFSSKWVSLYLYWAYRNAQNTHDGGQICFSSGRLSDATGFRFCKAAGIRTGKGGPSGNKRSVWGEREPSVGPNFPTQPSWRPALENFKWLIAHLFEKERRHLMYQ
jgi:hypothetical protein